MCILSSSKNFLQEMMKVGEAKSASSDFITVAQMIVRFGYSGFLAGHRPSEFFKYYDKPDEAIIDGCIASVAEALKLAGSVREPVFAIEFNIPQKSNTSEKVTWDIEQIILLDNREDSEYHTFGDALGEGDFPLNEWFWGSYKNVQTGEYKNKDGETKTRFMAVPVEVFANEAEAKATLGSGSNVAKSNSQWSDTLIANHAEPENFESFNGEEIRENYNKMMETKEKPYSGAPDLPDGDLTPPKIKQYLAQADMYNCTSDDITTVVDFIPF